MKILLIALFLVGCFLIIRKITSKKEPEYKSINYETRFKVIEIVDGDTFKISPGWKWNNEKGDTIRPTGYDTPEKEQPKYKEMKEKLAQLLLDKEVELKNPIKLTYNRLLCDVFIGERNLAEFFEEYRV